MVSKKTMEVNPKHSIMTELKKKAAADKSDTTMKALATTTTFPRSRRLRAPRTRPPRWRRSTEAAMRREREPPQAACHQALLINGARLDITLQPPLFLGEERSW